MILFRQLSPNDGFLNKCPELNTDFKSLLNQIGKNFLKNNKCHIRGGSDRIKEEKKEDPCPLLIKEQILTIT